jgi:tetratricopeptide (TPR) repeat protein
MRFARRRLVLAMALAVLVPGTTQADGVVSRGDALTEARRFEEAIALLENHLDANADDAAAWRQLGRAFIYSGEFDDAIKAQERAVSLRPDDVEFQLSLAAAYREKARRSGMISGMKNAKKWKAVLEHCVETWPENIESRLWLVRYLVHAPGIGGGDKDRALELSIETMRIDAYEGRLMVGYSHRLRGEFDAAVVVYDSCVAIYPDSARVWGAYAYTLLVAERLEAALPRFETWVELDPDDPESHAGLGDWGVEAEQYQLAEAAFRRALEVDPYYPQARYDLARMLEENKEYEKAQKEYATIVRTNPEFVKVGDAKKRAYRLKKKKR